MIRYALVCDHDHEFDGWFKGSEDFDRQAKRGLVACPICGSTKVSKALMAPAVSTSRRREAADTAPENATAKGAPAPQQAMAAPDPRAAELIEAMRRLKEHVTANADYVGRQFAEEARKIHYGEAEQRGIYGETTPQEAAGLFEEGIEIHPLPVLPDEKN